MAISKNKYLFLVLLASLAGGKAHAQGADPAIDAPSEEVNVYESLNSASEPKAPSSGNDVQMSSLEEQDDLQSLQEDIGTMVFKEGSKTDATPTATDLKNSPDAGAAASPTATAGPTKTNEKSGTLNIVNPKGQASDNDVMKNEKAEIIADESVNFDTGTEEKKLLELSKYVQNKITPKEWDDLAIKAKLDKYEVQKGDYLWKISKNLFGSGFYYSKIWSLNPQITNPHEIEPGTILAFDTGDADSFPKVQVGEFKDDEIEGTKTGGAYTNTDDKNRPEWLQDRKKLIDQGVYFQFASEETYEDLERLEKLQRNMEYEKYDPPLSDINIAEPGDAYDSSGFDKSNKITFNYREGFFLNTFITTNVVQDLGEIKATPQESVFIHKYATIYVTFDKSTKVKPGDLFSVYTAGGEIKHAVSDRSGYQYTTTAQIKAVRKIDDVWECTVVDQSGIVQRKDRITVYTPKIGKIAKTFSRRNVEAAIIGSYRDTISGSSFGDVVYLDRGRADGVELGNVFDVYSFVDRGTQRKITPSPTYKIGELTVINITDNFATALITGSMNEITVGSISITRTQEEQARRLHLKSKVKLNDVKKVEGKALDELDVELNLDDVSQDILNKADKIQLTEDELEELERQERDKSVIKDSKRDVKELDRLEGEIKDAESSLNESKVDEDKFLEQQSLDGLEKKSKQQDPNAFESLNEIEKDIGRKYLDEDINNKENPYGLTEFDLEEVDELLNTNLKK
ncbi:MAG: LysM peptidoglycan-binding domain-containing protein [Bacteriovorax sp.]|nr:LysM peptidoglycan-binding domain-containing protein [Bacteriovorax sp.]